MRPSTSTHTHNQKQLVAKRMSNEFPPFFFCVCFTCQLISGTHRSPCTMAQNRYKKPSCSCRAPQQSPTLHHGKHRNQSRHCENDTLNPPYKPQPTVTTNANICEDKTRGAGRGERNKNTLAKKQKIVNHTRRESLHA